MWCSSSFSARAVYRLHCGQEAPEDPQLVRRSRLVWKQRLPLKICLFGWLLLRRGLMTRTLRCRFDPEAPAVCPLCNEAEEDCSHLFFQCPLAQAAWRAASVGHLETSSDEEFWRSISGGVFCREVDWRRIFATLWSVWLHQNQVIFRGRPPCRRGDHARREGICFILASRRPRPLNHVPLYFVIISMTSGDTVPGVTCMTFKKQKKTRTSLM